MARTDESFLTRWKPHLAWEGGSHRASSRLFLAGLGLVYFVAFVSLWVQIHGLIGSSGILPAHEFLTLLLGKFGTAAQWRFPTLGWFLGTSDGTLHFLCAAGVFVSLLLMTGTLPALSALLCWILYLSLYTLAQRFLSFQWDILLLETGFLAIFLASPLAWNPRPRTAQAEPSLITLWLLRLLVFKLMFSSGVVKLSSGDPTWHDLTALAYHYETTCLPAWTGWLLYQLPRWFHMISALGMFAIELVVPFLVFAPRGFRLLAAACFTGLMLFIGITGNYGFFNLLSIVLCIPLLDDGYLPAKLRKLLVPELPAEEAPGPVAGETSLRLPRALPLGERRWPLSFLIVLAAFIGLLNIVPLLRAFRIPVEKPVFLAKLYEAQQSLNIVNGYGLFAVMTTSRPEIVVEGSNDLIEWKPYEFSYKPGDLKHRPGLYGFHMPRLDWLMWFAALGNVRQHPWFAHFLHRLLQGSPDVLRLLAANPFPNAPPRYIRAALYDYKFTTWSEHSETGAWWKREQHGYYLPAVLIPPNDPDSLALAPTPEPEAPPEEPGVLTPPEGKP